MLIVISLLFALTRGCCPNICLKGGDNGIVCRDMISVSSHRPIGVYCITAYYGEVCKSSNSGDCGWVCNTCNHCNKSVESRKYPIYLVDVRSYSPKLLVNNTNIWVGRNQSSIPRDPYNYPYGCNNNTGDLCTSYIPLTCVFGVNSEWDAPCNALVLMSIQATFYYTYNGTNYSELAVGEGIPIDGNFSRGTINKTYTLCGDVCDRTRKPTYAPTSTPAPITPGNAPLPPTESPVPINPPPPVEPPTESPVPINPPPPVEPPTSEPTTQPPCTYISRAACNVSVSVCTAVDVTQVGAIAPGYDSYKVTLQNIVESAEEQCSQVGKYLGFFFNNPFNVPITNITSPTYPLPFQIKETCYSPGAITDCGTGNTLHGCLPDIEFDYGVRLANPGMGSPYGSIILSVPAGTSYSFNDWQVGFRLQAVGYYNSSNFTNSFKSKDTVCVEVQHTLCDPPSILNLVKSLLPW
jgi:hypothetical protein